MTANVTTIFRYFSLRLNHKRSSYLESVYGVAGSENPGAARGQQSALLVTTKEFEPAKRPNQRDQLSCCDAYGRLLHRSHQHVIAGGKLSIYGSQPLVPLWLA